MPESPQEYVAQLIARAQSRKSRLGRALSSPTVGLIRRTTDGFLRNNDLLWASALTYTTGLSIVPILAVALSALTGLGAAETIRPLLERYLTAHSPEITDKLLSFVSNANAKTLGTVGAATLLFTVVLTLGTVEQAFNNIFQVTRGRTLQRRFADYLSITFAVPVILAGAVGVRQIIAHRLPEVPGAGWISSSIAVFAGFFFLYVFFPNRRVRFGAAAVGSVTAAVLLQLAQWGFIYFQLGVSKYAAIYGALAAIPVLLTWIYMTWVVVLLGGEVTVAFERRNEPLPMAKRWVAHSERVLALAIVLRLGERMAGRPGIVTPKTLAAELSVDEERLTEVLRCLEDAGLVVESASTDGPERGLFLARDSSAVRLTEVLDFVIGVPAVTASDERVDIVVERLRGAERETLGTLTVKDLVERPEAAGSMPPPQPRSAHHDAD